MFLFLFKATNSIQGRQGGYAKESVIIWLIVAIWLRFVQYLIINTAFVSIYTLVFMAADRYQPILMAEEEVIADLNNLGP